MKQIYLYLLSTIISVVIICLYIIFTIPVFPFNYLWFAMAVFLIIFAFMRGLLASMLASIFIVFAYGSYVLYKLYIVQNTAALTFNDIFWLFAFPLVSVTTGMLGRTIHQLVDISSNYQEYMKEKVLSDPITGFANERQFLLDLNEEVSRSVRYKRPVILIIIQIAFFRELNSEYGVKSVESFLQQVAEKIQLVLREVDKKAYMGNGMYAAILPETSVEKIEVVIGRLLAEINECFIVSAKKSKKINIKVKVGYAGCPEDQQESLALLEHAKRGLIFDVG